MRFNSSIWKLHVTANQIVPAQLTSIHDRFEIGYMRIDKQLVADVLAVP